MAGFVTLFLLVFFAAIGPSFAAQPKQSSQAGICSAPAPQVPAPQAPAPSNVSESCLTFTQQGTPRDGPPQTTLCTIASKITKASTTSAVFVAVPGTVNDRCGMQSFDMTLSRETGAKHKFCVLSEKGSAQARNVFASTSGLAADADGSPRAYHPLDPAGKGECKLTVDLKGNIVVSDSRICALDTLPDGGVRAFRNRKEVAPVTLGSDWTKFWTLISTRKLASIDLQDATGIDFGDHYYFYYWKEEDLTVVFKDENIRRTAQSGPPCVRNDKSAFSGYFVSETTLKHQNDVPGAEAAGVEIAPPECHALRNIDAEAVPFFVIPGGALEGAAIGDVVVARVVDGPKQALVFGIAADAGPIGKFGEGSALFNQLLFVENPKPVINNAKLDNLDQDRAVAILILGGTGQQLNQDYRRENVEKVAKAAFAKWGMEKNLDPVDRFDACVPGAKINVRPKP
jgi:hypothetical protein